MTSINRLLCAAAVMTGTVAAAVISYDGAEYDVGLSNLFGKGTGTGWAEVWTNDGFATWNTSIAAGSLGYTNAGRVLTTSGNKFRTGNGDGCIRTIDTAPFASLTTPEGKFGKDDTAIWISMLINRYNTDRMSGIVLKEGWGWSGVERHRLGTSHESLGLNVYAYPETGYSVTNNETALLVVRVAFTAGNDVVTMWVNPGLGAEAPADSAGWSGPGSVVANFTFNRIALRYIENKCEVDEVRIGETWGDVTPHTVIAGWPALAITTTPATVANAMAAMTIAGTGAYLEGEIWWSNTLNGAYGSVAAADAFGFSVPLEVGANQIEVSGSNGFAKVTDSVLITRRGLPYVNITSQYETVIGASVEIAGECNDETVGGLHWRNAKTGAEGVLAAAAAWQFTAALAAGENVITVTGTNSSNYATNDSIAVLMIATNGLIAYDGGSYPPGNNTLVGQGSGLGWHEAWTNDGYETYNTTIMSGSLGYSKNGKTLLTSGNRFRVGSGDGARRTLATNGWEALLAENGQYGAPGAVIWVSVLAQRNSGTDQSFITLLDGYGWSGVEKLHLGAMKKKTDPAQDDNWGYPDSGVAVADGVGVLLVARITFADGDEFVTLWVNPDLGAQPPDSQGVSGRSVPEEDFTFFRARIRYGSADFDELRFGTTWEAVTPYESLPDTAPVIYITNAPAYLAPEQAACVIAGTNNASVADMAWWSNRAPGETNWFARSGQAWSFTSPINFFDTIIHIAATNSAGEWYSDSVQIYREPYWPVVTINGPPLLTVRRGVTTVGIAGANNGNVNGDCAWINRRVPGTTNWFSRTGTAWAASITNLQPGVNLIAVMATNYIGLVTNANVSVLRSADLRQPVCLTSQSNTLYGSPFPFGRYLTGSGREQGNLYFLPRCNDFGEYKYAVLNNGVWDNADDYVDTWGGDSAHDAVGYWFRHPVSVSAVTWQQRLFGDGGWFRADPVVQYTTSYRTGDEGVWQDMPVAVRSNSLGHAEWYYLKNVTNSAGSVSARFFWYPPASFTATVSTIRGVRIVGAPSDMIANSDSNGFVGFVEAEVWGYMHAGGSLDAEALEQGNVAPGRFAPVSSGVSYGSASTLADGYFAVGQDGWSYDYDKETMYQSAGGDVYFGLLAAMPYSNLCAVGVEMVNQLPDGSLFSSFAFEYSNEYTAGWEPIPNVNMGALDTAALRVDSASTHPAWLCTFPELETCYGVRMKGAAPGQVGCTEMQLFFASDVPEPCAVALLGLVWAAALRRVKRSLAPRIPAD